MFRIDFLNKFVDYSIIKNSKLCKPTTHNPFCLILLVGFLLLFNAPKIIAQAPTYGQSLTLFSSEQSALNQKIVDYSVFKLQPLQLWSDLEYGVAQSANFTLNVGDEVITLNLQKSSLYSDGALMSLQSDSVPLLQDLTNEYVYRGFVDGDSSQLAGFIIGHDDLFGYYESQGQTWFISNLGGFIDSSQTDKSSAFIKYSKHIDTNFICATLEGIDSSFETSTQVRVAGEWHFELAYDVDYAMYSAFLPVQPDKPSPEEQIKDYLEKVTLTVEAYYQKIVAALHFHIVDINIWASEAKQPYKPGDITTHWTEGKDWWESAASGKSCIQRDAVTLMSGRGLGANGYVAPIGQNVICGSPLNLPCIQPYPYNVVTYHGDSLRTARTVAHELAHNFGRSGHACLCNIMYANAPTFNCSIACDTISPTWDATTSNLIRRRFDPTFLVCKPGIPNQASEACLRSAPPVDLSFKLTLEADQVILTSKSVVCPGEEFTANFYNTYDPNGSIQWELGPGLQFSLNQPISNKIRNIIPNAMCCYPFDTWIKVSFNYNCTGPVIYQRKVRVNSSFSLDGVYAGPNGIVNKLNAVNFVLQGSHDIKLENQAATYTWIQTIGNTTTTLPYTTYAISFGMPWNQSVSFFVSTPNECGIMNRTVSFVSPNNLKGGGKSTAGIAIVYPNPTSGLFLLDVREIFDTYSEVLEGRILDRTGRLIQQFSIDGNNQKSLDISNFSSGIYFLQVVSNNSLITQKIEKI